MLNYLLGCCISCSWGSNILKGGSKASRDGNYTTRRGGRRFDGVVVARRLQAATGAAAHERTSTSYSKLEELPPVEVRR